jgi:hypothetical protein
VAAFNLLAERKIKNDLELLEWRRTVHCPIGDMAMLFVPKTSAPDNKPRRRRWIRYGLRTVLILLTIVCLWLGWFMTQVQKQRRAVAVLEKYSAAITYSAFYQYSPWSAILPRRLIQWLNGALSGNDILQRVTGVTIERDTLDEQDLAVLTDLPYLRYLSLSGPAVTDASVHHVENLTQLKCFKLIGTNVSDAGLQFVSKLENVESLILTETPFTEAGIKHLRNLKNIDELYLDDTRVTGACLEDLTAIKNLRVLHLNNTHVRGEGIIQFSEMPNLEIVFLKNTPISDADLPFLKQIPSHVLVYLSKTKISREAAQQLPKTMNFVSSPTVPKPPASE